MSLGKPIVLPFLSICSYLPWLRTVLEPLFYSRSQKLSTTVIKRTIIVFKCCNNILKQHWSVLCFSHNAKSNEFSLHALGSAHHIVPLGLNFLSLSVTPVKVQFSFIKQIHIQPVPRESRLCCRQGFKYNSRCLSSALDRRSITGNHRVKVCPHTQLHLGPHASLTKG